MYRYFQVVQANAANAVSISLANIPDNANQPTAASSLDLDNSRSSSSPS